MPTREIKTTLALDGEKKFKQELQAAARELRVLGSETKANTSAFGDNAKSIEALTIKNQGLTKQAAQQKDIVNALTKAVEDSAAKYGEADKRTDGYRIKLNNAIASLNKMENEIQQNNKAIDNYSKETLEAAKNSDEMKYAQEKLGKTLDFVKGAAIAAAGAIAGVFIGSASFGTKSKAALNGLQAQTGATKEEMEALKQVVTDIYTDNLGDSIEDVADSMAQVKQITKQTGDELKGTTKQALLMRDTFNFDVEESINTVNGLMENFKITSEEAYTLIAQGAQQGANKNGDLLDVMNEYSVQFAKLGLSAEEFTNVLISGAEQGAFQIDKVGDAVKEFAVRAVDGSKTTQEGFDQIGLDAKVMSKAISKGGDTAKKAFDKTLDALLSIEDPLKQQQAGVALFGTQFEDLGVKGLSALRDIKNNADMSADILQKINEVKYDDAGAALEGLKRQILTNVAGPIGEELTPRITEMINKVKEFDMTPVLDALNWILDNAGTIAALAAGIGVGMATWNIASMVIGVVKAIKAFKTALIAAEVAQKGLNIAMKANVIGIVVAAVAALVTGLIVLWNTNEDFRNAVIEIWDSIYRTISFAAETIIKFFTVTIPHAFNKALTSMKTWISNMIETAKVEIPKVINTVLSFFAELPGKMLNIGSDVVHGLWDGINGAASWLKNKITSFASSVISSFKNAFGIHSPSKVMRDEIGSMIGAGMAEGIIKSSRLVNLAIDDLNKDLLSRAVKNISSNMDINVNGNTDRAISRGTMRRNLTIINQGTIVGTNGMEEFASIISKKVANQYGLCSGGSW